MELHIRYVVAKYNTEIDAVISAVNNEDLDSGSNTVYKPYVYQITDDAGNTVTKQIDDFYRAVIEYDKTTKKITVTEYQLNKYADYYEVGTVTLTVDEYNSIKSSL